MVTICIFDGVTLQTSHITNNRHNTLPHLSILHPYFLPLLGTLWIASQGRGKSVPGDPLKFYFFPTSLLINFFEPNVFVKVPLIV